MTCRNCSCPACKPDATPKGDGGATIGYGWHMNYGDGSRASDGVSEAEEQAAPPVATSGYRSATPVPVSANDFSGWNHGSTEYESRTLQNQCLIGQLLIEQRDSNPPVPIVTPESMSLLEHHCSDADFATIGKLRDESYAAGYQAGRDDAARLNIQQVSHVVELGPATLRALVAALLSDHQRRDVSGVEWADALLTHLHEREMK